jgi:hypothetical protein
MLLHVDLCARQASQAPLLRCCCPQVNDFSLLLKWQGRNASLPPALFISHLDVVPIAPGSEQDWTHPPFDGVIADAWAYAATCARLSQTWCIDPPTPTPCHAASLHLPHPPDTAYLTQPPDTAYLTQPPDTPYLTQPPLPPHSYVWGRGAL